jgi:hypothetical protein
MTVRGALVGLVGAAALLSGCGRSPSSPAASPGQPPSPVAATTTAAAAATPAPASATPPAASPAPPPSVVKETAATAKAAAEVLTASTPHYEIKGRRDPFENLELTMKEREAGPAVSVVASSKLTGIVRGAGTALALLETAQGMGYILKTGDTLGEGRLLEIGAEEVVFSVPPKPGSTANRVVLKITKD